MVRRKKNSITINITSTTNGEILNSCIKEETSKEEKQLTNIFCQCRKCRLHGMCPNFGERYNKKLLKKMLEWEAP